MTLIPYYQVNPEHNFTNTAENRIFPGKYFLLFFKYFINQYMVIDDADSEFLYGLQVNPNYNFSLDRGKLKFTGKIFFSIFKYYYQPENGYRLR